MTSWAMGNSDLIHEKNWMLSVFCFVLGGHLVVFFKL